MKIIRSKEWWLRLAKREGDATVHAGVPDHCPRCDGTGDVHRADGEWLGKCDCGATGPNARGPKNGWMTPEEHRQHLDQLARLKARLFSGEPK